MNQERGYRIVRFSEDYIGELLWDGHRMRTVPCRTYEKARTKVREMYRSYFRTIVVEGGVMVVQMEDGDCIVPGGTKAPEDVGK